MKNINVLEYMLELFQQFVQVKQNRTHLQEFLIIFSVRTLQEKLHTTFKQFDSAGAHLRNLLSDSFSLIFVQSVPGDKTTQLAFKT